MLVRLTLRSDRTDQSDDAIWQHSILQLRRLISSLTLADGVQSWDVAQLTLARARYFIPMLARQTPEFSIALQP